MSGKPGKREVIFSLS